MSDHGADGSPEPTDPDRSDHGSDYSLFEFDNAEHLAQLQVNIFDDDDLSLPGPVIDSPGSPRTGSPGTDVEYGPSDWVNTPALGLASLPVDMAATPFSNFLAPSFTSPPRAFNSPRVFYPHANASIAGGPTPRLLSDPDLGPPSVAAVGYDAASSRRDVNDESSRDDSFIPENLVAPPFPHYSDPDEDDEGGPPEPPDDDSDSDGFYTSAGDLGYRLPYRATMTRAVTQAVESVGWKV